MRKIPDRSLVIYICQCINNAIPTYFDIYANDCSMHNNSTITNSSLRGHIGCRGNNRCQFTSCIFYFIVKFDPDFWISDETYSNYKFGLIDIIGDIIICAYNLIS